MLSWQYFLLIACRIERQITKSKPSFTNDDSLRRMLYLASQRIVKHWHARCQNWDLVLSQLEIMFADRAVG